MTPIARIAVSLLGCALVLGTLLGARADEGERVKVPRDLVAFDDGDSFAIRWPAGPEVVRILGVDTPEVRHLDHDIPYAQPFGDKAAGFLEGCLAVADEIVLLRSGQTDPYGRTLGYLILDGRNYSVLVLRARLAIETVSHFGNNGLPEQAAEVLEASQKVGPVAFEQPSRYRRRMKALSEWMRANGTYPGEDAPVADATREE